MVSELDASTIHTATNPRDDLLAFLKQKELTLLINGNALAATRYIGRMRVVLSRVRNDMRAKRKPFPNFRTKITELRPHLIQPNKTIVKIELQAKAQVISIGIETELENIMKQFETRAEETVNG